MIPYNDFLLTKMVEDNKIGLSVNGPLHSPAHFPFQADIVRWGLAKGKVLFGEECGLGKGLQILEFCQQVCNSTGKPALVFAPPGVKLQFKYEAEKFGFQVNIIKEQSEVKDGINITNYERLMVRERVDPDGVDSYLDFYSDYSPLEIRRYKDYVQMERYRFLSSKFSCIALDEGSILKDYNSITRKRLTTFSRKIPFGLVSTATFAPNDFTELINYAEFLGIASGKQIRAKFFIQDGNSASKYRIKRPAWKDFWKWISNWLVMIRYPSDLGYSNEGYELPQYHEYLVTVEDTTRPEGELFPRDAISLSEQSALKRRTVKERCQVAIDLALGKSISVLDVTNNAKRQMSIPTNKRIVIWVRRNDEGIYLNKRIPDSIEVAGRHDEDYKEKAFMDFARGEGPRIMITKPGIGGLGLNWQVCHYAIEVNIDHSYEQQHQADRRLWRFMQQEDCHFFRVAMDTEGNIISNRVRKRKQMDVMYKEIAKEMKVHELQQAQMVGKEEDEYMTNYATSNRTIEDQLMWELHQGDSVDKLEELDDKSVGQVITSVPFPSMYVYTSSPRDIGNYEGIEGCVDHLAYVFKELLPKMMPGRLVEIHLANAVAHLNREGFIGMVDFRGPLVKMMTELGYTWHGEVTIEKDPQTERARNNTLGLLQKTLGRDAVHMRSSVSDYVVQFRAPGTNPEPIIALLAHPSISGDYDNPNGWITIEMWINWASNVWYKYRQGMRWWEAINVTNVIGARKGGLGVRDARTKDDEAHLCELQLDVIERLCALHSNPGDLIVDPFNGIGSTGWQILQMGRRYWGCELKESYYKATLKNLYNVESASQQLDLFSMAGVEVEETYKSIHDKWKRKRGISLEGDEVVKSTNWGQWQSLLDYMREGGLI